MTTQAADPRTLHITGRSDHGGGPEHLYQLVQVIGDAGSTLIACPRKGVYWSRYAELLGADHLIHIPHRRFDPATVLRLVREVRAQKVQVVHSHGMSAGLYARLVGLMTGVPVVHTFHGVAVGRGWKQRIHGVVELILSRWTRIGIAVSLGERAVIERQYPCHRGRIVVVPNGIALGSGVTPVKESQEVVRVVGFSRNNQQKHPELVAGILERCTPEICARMEVHLYGEGLMDSPQLRDAQARGLPLHLHPPTDDPQAELARAHIYLSTSRWEGLPIALLEAWRAGTCVMATSVVGNNDVVQHLRNGLLFPCSDRDLGAQAMTRLVTDQRLRSTLGAQAFNDLHCRFGRELMGRRMRRIHRWVIAICP